jgi:hypothetical protein
VRNPHGYGVWSSDTGIKEADSITCGHCQQVVFVKPGSATTVYLIYGMDPTAPPKETPGAGCRVCMRPVCLRCEAAGRCTPFERQIEASEARQRLMRAVLGV